MTGIRRSNRRRLSKVLNSVVLVGPSMEIEIAKNL